MHELRLRAPEPRDLLTVARPGEEIEVVLTEQQSSSAEVRHGQLETVLSGSLRRIEVRVRSDGTLRRAGSSLEEWEPLLTAARSALPTPSEAGFAPPEDTRSAPDDPPDPAAGEGAARSAVGMAEALRDVGPGFLPQATATVRWTEQRIVNTLGLVHTSRVRNSQLTGGGRAVQGGDFHAVHRSAIGRDLPDVPGVAAEVADRFGWGREIARLDAGSYTVVLAPQIVLSLLAPVLNRMSGPALVAGTSPWIGRLGDTVLHAGIRLASDPTLPDGPRRGPRDDEGTPSSLLPLIDGGRLENFILDREAAARLGQRAGGTAYAESPGDAPSARPSCLTMSAGDLAFGKVLRAAPRLLLLEGWIGARPTSPLRGEIAGNAVGLYLVEEGAILGRIKNAVVSLDVFAALGDRLAGLSSHREWVAGGMLQVAPALLPYALVEGVKVALRG